MFTHVFFTEDVSEGLSTKLIEAIKRCKIFKKNTPFADLFSVKLDSGARSVFQSIRHPEHGHVLLWRKNFLAFQHNEYEQYLNNAKKIFNHNFENNYKCSLVNLFAPAAAVGPKTLALKRKNKKSSRPEKITTVLDIPYNENVDVRISYRDEVFKPSDEQVLMFDSLIEAQGNMCVTGGAGAGKTLLAEKVLITLAAQSNQLVYLTPSRNLAREMLASMHSARVANVICLSLADLAGGINGKDTFQECLPHNTMADYEKICQLAALQCAPTQDGAAYKTLVSYSDVLTQYRTELSRSGKADFNVIGTGFPLGLLNATDSLIIDEFQQFSFPLLLEFDKLSCRKFLFGDNNQAVNITAQISLHYIQALAQQCVLPTTFRVPSFVARFANAVLHNKNKRFSQKSTPLLITTEQKAGNIYWCEQKTLMSNKITVSINTAVVCLDADDFSWAKNIFSESNLYNPNDILGLEFDNIIVILSRKHLKIFLNTDKSSKADAVLLHSEQMSLYASLYVVLTRTKQNLLLLTNHERDTNNFISQYDVKPTKLTAPPQVQEHFGSKHVTIQTIVQYINNEIQNGNLKRAEQLYRQHWAHPGAVFVTFCVAHGIDISSFVSPKAYTSAIIDRAKVLLMGRYFTPQEAQFFTQHQSVLIACCNDHHISSQLLKMFKDTFCFSGLMNMVKNPQLLEGTQVNAFKSLVWCIENVPPTDTTSLDNVFLSLIEIVKHSQNIEMIQKQACYALIVCLARTNSSEARSSALNRVLLCFVEIIACTQYQEQTRNLACQMLTRCLIEISPSETIHSSLKNVLPCLMELIVCAQYHEQTRSQACQTLGWCLNRINPSEVKSLQKLFPSLIAMIASSQYTQETQGHACTALNCCLQQINSPPELASVKGLPATVVAIIACAQYTATTRGQACMALGHYLDKMGGSSDITSIETVLPSLINIIMCAQNTVSFQSQACFALGNALKRKEACVDAISFKDLLPHIAKIIVCDKNTEEDRGNACSALISCLGRRKEAPDARLLESLIPSLLKILACEQHSELNRTLACIVLSSSLSLITLEDKTSLMPVFSILIKIIECSQYTEDFRSCACLMLRITIKSLKPMNSKTVNPVLSSLIQMIRCDTITHPTQNYACTTLTTCLQEAELKDKKLLIPVLPKLIQMIRCDNFTEQSQQDCCVLLIMCLKKTELNETQLLNGVIPNLINIINNIKFTQTHRISACEALVWCVLKSKDPIHTAPVESMLPGLAEMINHSDYNEETKITACNVICSCRMKLNSMDPALFNSLFHGLIEMINYSDYSERAIAYGCKAFIPCLPHVSPSDAKSLHNLSASLVEFINNTDFEELTRAIAQKLLTQIEVWFSKGACAGAP